VTLQDIQVFLRCIISKETIIIGHSLDTDLKALRIIHRRIIDTSAIFPHYVGLPHKISLKKLAKDYLNQEIQDSVHGHDSIEDSLTALELLLFQVRFLSFLL
jgi:RNA exonuclease 1